VDTLRKAVSVARKDIRVFLKDTGFMISLFLLPLGVSLFTAGMNSGGDEGGIDLPVAIVQQDPGSYGKAVEDALAAVPDFELSRIDSADRASEEVLKGEYLVAVVVPPDFSARIDAYEPVEITAVVDPAQAQYGRMVTTVLTEVGEALAVQGEIRYGVNTVLAEAGPALTDDPELARAAQAQTEGVIFTQLQLMDSDPPIDVVEQTISGDDVFTWDNLFSLVLPSFMVMFAFFVVPAASTEIIKEKESGALRRLVAAPLPRSSLLGGKVLAYLLVVVFQVVLTLGVGALLLGMPLRGSAAGLVLTTLALGLVATTLGIMLATLARSADQASGIGMVIIFGLGFLSGALTPADPLYRLEGPLGLVSLYTPQAQATISYHTLLLQDGDLARVLPNILFALSVVFFLVAVWRFRYRG
jgi:ABC-2 type transport system permease protein